MVKDVQKLASSPVGRVMNGIGMCEMVVRRVVLSTAVPPHDGRLHGSTCQTCYPPSGRAAWHLPLGFFKARRPQTTADECILLALSTPSCQLVFPPNSLPPPKAWTFYPCCAPFCSPLCRYRQHLPSSRGRLAGSGGNCTGMPIRGVPAGLQTSNTSYA